MSSPGSSSSGVTVQEYSVRVPKVQQKQNCVMQFNSSLLVDFTKWNQVKMVREVPIKEAAGEEAPKFGAGSEFGKDLREEARRKKLGIVAKKHAPDSYPWLMKVGGKAGKKYRGVRGGSITENASYYVFTQAKDGAFEACPVSEWYNFQHVQRYKALTAEEAEEQFTKRDKIMNYFSVMVKKRLKNEDDVDEDSEGQKDKKKGGKKKKGEDFKLTDMDEWPDSSEGEEDGSGDEAEDEEDKKKKKKRDTKEKQKKKKRKSDVKDEAFEDSDDGDDEGREMDYISDSSDSEDDLKPAAEEKGVDQEDALKRLLDSDAEVEESSEEEKKSDGEDEKKEDEEPQAGEKRKKSKKKKKKKEDEPEKEEDSGDSDAVDSSDDEKAAAAKAKGDGTGNSSAASSGTTVTKAEKIVNDMKQAADGSNAPSGGKRSKLESGGMKRKPEDGAGLTSVAKRAKLESVPSPQIASDTGITEEAVRRYLTRKPMTTTELLQKFKSKKVGLSSDQLVPVIAQILKKINPNKQTIKGKMYLSIKK
ncbi:general transcription factor IIF subunit 1-like [Pollicipes pollicipes]|uniref:general transcription factor IIF subunit 1-like n=1 Tax=Pollicipes pollicipes TaxID=41117 RepID=UPI001884ABBD|nr:general transcription factor IIF subunit 1-like [Pollicipes pollicipes]